MHSGRGHPLLQPLPPPECSSLYKLKRGRLEFKEPVTTGSCSTEFQEVGSYIESEPQKSAYVSPQSRLDTRQQKRWYNLQSLKYLLSAFYRSSLTIIVLEIKNIIFKVSFSLDEINNRLDTAKEKKSVHGKTIMEPSENETNREKKNTEN